MTQKRGRGGPQRKHKPHRHGPESITYPQPGPSSHRQPCVAGLKSRSANRLPLLQLRVISHVLQGLPQGCKTCSSRPVSFLCLAPCCTVLRSRCCQNSVKRSWITRNSCLLFKCRSQASAYGTIGCSDLPDTLTAEHSRYHLTVGGLYGTLDVDFRRRSFARTRVNGTGSNETG